MIERMMGMQWTILNCTLWGMSQADIKLASPRIQLRYV